MGLKEIVSLLRGKGLISEEDAKTLETEEGSKGPSPSPDLSQIERLVHNKEAIAALRDLIEKRDADLKEARALIAERDKTIAAYETDKAERDRLIGEETKKKREKEIEEVLTKAISEGKIPAKNEETISKFRAILSDKFEEGKSVIESIPAANKFDHKKTEHTEKTPFGGNGDKTFADTLAAAMEELKS